MAYTRYTGGTFGIYRTVRGPDGKRREECLVRLGPYETPAEAIDGYRKELKHLRSVVARCNADSRAQYNRSVIHDRVQAESAIERLEPKLAAVERFLVEHPEYAQEARESDA